MCDWRNGAASGQHCSVLTTEIIEADLSHLYLNLFTLRLKQDQIGTSSLLVKNEAAGITKQAFSFHSITFCAFNSRRFLLQSLSLRSYSI